MSVAIVGIGGAIGLAGAAATGYAAYSSSNSADKSSASANRLSQEDLAWQKERYATSKNHFRWQKDQARVDFQKATDRGEEVVGEARAQNKQYQGESDYYKHKADTYESTMEDFQTAGGQFMGRAADYEKQMEAHFGDFIDNFQTMLGTNDTAMADFQRRYGPLMDNVADGIVETQKFTANQFSAQGREQLSLDAETLSKTMNNQLASRNMGRSGMSIESERRLASDTMNQARSIDVNAQQQATQLNNMQEQQRNQNLNSLNQMQGMQQGLFDQRVGLQGQYGQGFQQMGNNMGQLSQQQIQQGQLMYNQGNTMGNMAGNYYGASQNMFGRGFASMNNAQNNIGNLYGNRASQNLGATNSFYNGVQAPNAANAINSLNNQASSQRADAAGYAQAAGTALSNVDWSSMGGKTAQPATAAGNTTR